MRCRPVFTSSPLPPKSAPFHHPAGGRARHCPCAASPSPRVAPSRPSPARAAPQTRFLPVPTAAPGPTRACEAEEGTQRCQGRDALPGTRRETAALSRTAAKEGCGLRVRTRVDAAWGEGIIARRFPPRRILPPSVLGKAFLKASVQNKASCSYVAKMEANLLQLQLVYLQRWQREQQLRECDGAVFRSLVSGDATHAFSTPFPTGGPLPPPPPPLAPSHHSPAPSQEACATGKFRAQVLQADAERFLADPGSTRTGQVSKPHCRACPAARFVSVRPPPHTRATCRRSRGC